MELYESAILVGILLSLVFIGPVFFLLIETSITRGWKAALALDLGVIACDLLFIFIFYFSLHDVSEYIEQHPELKKSMLRIGGIVLLVYGTVMIFQKIKIKHLRRKKYKDTNYFKMFWNGFLLNFLNIGVIFFWFGIVSSLAIQYPNPKEFIQYITIAFGTFLAIDIMKILLANRLQGVMTIRNVIKLRRIMGIILIVFGTLLIAKSYGAFSKIDAQIQQQLPK